ncbi:divalent cation tolerance protein [Embleya hyalina]|uniref:Divalent cation tolerance protein n=2 Tax=Embleya hyalina TaxID=516124 RepID=A0A401YI89_9ACTN|nr:divalent cation tolerance protein [Embleya hyalina]
MTGYMVVITTTDGSEAAEALARGGVEARVAACAQIVGPIRSVYWWDGRVQDDPEYQVWFKAPADRFQDIRDYILGAHTYDTPEVIQLPITAGSAAYLAWLTDETKPR